MPRCPRRAVVGVAALALVVAFAHEGVCQSRSTYAVGSNSIEVVVPGLFANRYEDNPLYRPDLFRMAAYSVQTPITQDYELAARYTRRVQRFISVGVAVQSGRYRGHGYSTFVSGDADLDSTVVVTGVSGFVRVSYYGKRYVPYGLLGVGYRRMTLTDERSWVTRYAPYDTYQGVHTERLDKLGLDLRAAVDVYIMRHVFVAGEIGYFNATGRLDFRSVGFGMSYGVTW